jgi:hypothetical protein
MLVLTLSGLLLAGLASPSTASAQSAPEPVAPTAGAEAVVVVHVDGPDASKVDRYDPGLGAWRQVCVTPCDAQLPLLGDYRVEGDGFRDSHPFRLSGTPGQRVIVSVDPGWGAWRVVGIVMIPVSGVSLMFGAMMGLIGTVADGASSWQANLGWGAAVAGAAGIAGGIALIVNNRHTNVEQKVVAAREHALQAAAAWKPAPTWRELPPEQKALPAAAGLPLWSVAF